MSKNACSTSKKRGKSVVTLFPRPPSPKSKSKSKFHKKSSALSNRLNTTQSTTRSKSVTSTLDTKDSIPDMVTVKTPQIQKVSNTLASPESHSFSEFLKTSAPATPSDSGSTIASEVEEDETSQMWILRHLRLHLKDVNDSDLVNFVLQQDISPFINFMMNFRNEKKCLFIIVTRYKFRPVETPAIMVEETAPTPANAKEKSKSIEVATTKATNGSDNKMLKPKTKIKRKKLKTVIQAEEATTMDHKCESRQQFIDEIIEHDRLTVPLQEATIQLQWSDARVIPDNPEFVFIVSRMRERKSERSELDQQYFTGYVRNCRALKKAREIAHQIFTTKMNFEREIDLLLYAVSAINNNILNREKWQNSKENFENFISDALGRAFWQSTGLNDSTILLDDQRSAVESVESLLEPRIQAFIKDPTKSNQTRLWLELSLYELKFFNGNNPLDQIADQLKRTLTIFQTLTVLSTFKDATVSTTEWLQKAVFYTIELVARLIAANLKDQVEELTVDLFLEQPMSLNPVDSKIREIAKFTFVELIKIGTTELYSITSEEYSTLENIKLCLKLFDYIENEIEKIAKHVSYMRSPIHDMLIDRRPLNKGFAILKSIKLLFEETFFESALENGNVETVKSVYQRLATNRKLLKEIVSTLKSDRVV